MEPKINYSIEQSKVPTCLFAFREEVWTKQSFSPYVCQSINITV